MWYFNRLKEFFRSQRGFSRSHYSFVIKDWTALTDIKLAAKVLDTKRFSRNVQPTLERAPTGSKILVIAPHPDDDTFGAGGTLIQALEGKSSVEVVYVTDGRPPDGDVEKIRDNAREVCSLMGMTPRFLGHEIGAININRLISSIAECINSVSPDLIMVPFLLDDHDEHRLINEALMSATSLKLFEPVGIYIWAYQIYSSILPNVVVDITGIVDQKKQAMSKWTGVAGKRNWSHYVLGVNASNSRYIATKDEVYAEAFFVVPILEYTDLCATYFSEGHSKCYYSEFYQRPRS